MITHYRNIFLGILFVCLATGVLAQNNSGGRIMKPPIHITPPENNSKSLTPSGLSPATIRSAYNLPTTGGSGTIAIIDAYDNPSAQHDYNVFCVQYGLPTATSSNFEIHKMSNNVHGDTGWAGEIALDIQWAHAIAPNAKILLVEANSAYDTDLLAAVDYARNRSDVVAISMSWGGPESNTDYLYDSHFTSSYGASFFASSGDNGHEVNYPAVSPNVISVGGTELVFSGNTLSKETAWDGSGGGLSAYMAEPTYQTNFGVWGTGGKRAVPDVSYNGGPSSAVSVYITYGGTGWYKVWGTSAGSPQWAAIRALGGTVVTNTTLYQLASNANKYAANFRDVTIGKNGSCGSYCNATAGYDYVTGLGSPLSATFNNGQPVIAGFYGTPVSGTGPLTSLFIDTSANSPTTWNWSFGDGSTMTGKKYPSHVYATVSSPTSYSIRLIAGNAYGASTVTYPHYVTINPPSSPVYSDVPDLKLFMGQSLPNAFDLADYNTADSATSFSIISSFLTLATNSGSIVAQDAYASSTIGTNIFTAENLFGSTTSTNEVKYSTYKIFELPQIVLRPGSSKSINVFNYTVDSTLNHVVPTSFGNSDSLVVGDTTQVSAVWSDSSTVTITATPAFTVPVNVFVIASPSATAPFGVDIDKENFGVFPSLSTTAFEFSNASDTAIFSFQVPGGATGLPTISQFTGISDSSGSSSNGGVLKVTFASPSSGVKITPSFTTWLSNAAGTYYTLRARVFGTSTANNYLQLLFNGNPTKSPTDVQGYFLYSVPTVWREIEIPISSYSPVSSTPVMYPQLVLKANGATGTVYIDEMEIFQAVPMLIGASRSITNDKYIGGFWNEGSATTQWAIQTMNGSPSINVANGAMYLITTGTSSTQSGMKFTASTATGTIYTVAANPGKQMGGHLKAKLIAGNTNISLTQVQVNLLGVNAPNSFSTGGDIASAAEIGRISDRTLKLSFTPVKSYYQYQFVIKNSGNSSIQIDNTQADVDYNDPNYGDATLYP